MSSRIASLLTISSLTRLHSKSSSRNIGDSIKICNALKTINTSAQRSNIQFASACDQDDSLNYQQNHAEFYPESQNDIVSHQLPYRQSPDNVIQAHASGFCGGSSVGNWNCLNQDQGYTEGLQNEFGNKSTECGGNFTGFFGQRNGSPERISSGINQISDVSNLSSSINVLQNTLVGQRGNVDGKCGQSNTEMQQNVNWVGVNNLKRSGKHPNAFVENQDGYYAQHSGSSEHKLNGISGNLQSACRSWTDGPTERGHYSSAHSSQIPSESLGNLKGNLNQNLSHFQQAPRNQFPWSNSINNQYNPGSGQFLQNLKDNQYPPNLQTVHSSMIGSHISNNGKPEEESAEASDDSPYSGTLEELDHFCMEGKVKEAVEVLGLLEKQRIPVDLPRYLQLIHQCGEAKALEEAKFIHEHVLRYLSPLKVSTYNKILEMYSKCGSMDDAFKVFNNMPKRNLTTWDTMIT